MSVLASVALGLNCRARITDNKMMQATLNTTKRIAVFGASLAGASLLFAAAAFAIHPVTTAEIANSAVTSSKIADGTITAAGLASNSVGSSEIASSAVGSSEIAAGAVTASEIASSAVGASEIAAGAVGTSEIATNGVADVDVVDTLTINGGTIEDTPIGSTYPREAEFMELTAWDAATFLSYAGFTDISISGVFNLGFDTLIVDADGAGTPAEGTLEINSSFTEVQCDDSDGCNITLGETNSEEGDILIAENISTPSATFSDTAG